MKVKRIIYLVLVLIILLFIFIMSNENINDTNSISKGLINKFLLFLEELLSINLNNKSIINILNVPVRKLAHFTEFFILGIFTYKFLNTFSFKTSLTIIISLIICFICASLDEFHQIFSFGRSPKILDIFIDFFGSFVSTFILMKINRQNN